MRYLVRRDRTEQTELRRQTERRRQTSLSGCLLFPFLVWVSGCHAWSPPPCHCSSRQNGTVKRLGKSEFLARLCQQEPGEPSTVVSLVDKEQQQHKQPLICQGGDRCGHFSKRGSSGHGADDKTVANMPTSKRLATHPWNAGFGRVCGHACLTLCLVLVAVFGTLGMFDSPAAASSTNNPAAPAVVEYQHLPYWNAMASPDVEIRAAANRQLLDYVVGTTHTMLYDPTGGVRFDARTYEKAFRTWLKQQSVEELASREMVTASLKERVASLSDPYSAYLTREELRLELAPSQSQGFLGLGAMVSGPPEEDVRRGPATAEPRPAGLVSLEASRRLPVVTAVAPNSHAERAGLTVGDLIVGVDDESFLHKHANCVRSALNLYNNAQPQQYTTVTVAKPLYASIEVMTPRPPVAMVSENSQDSTEEEPSNYRNVVRAYRPTRVRLPQDDRPAESSSQIVQYELLQSSLFLDRPSPSVGYIRLTRFSKASTAGFVQAVQELEKAGAQQYILDLRNNYGGVVQEAMLEASTLLRDPHAVLCYTMNARGGFTPHDVEEYVVDHRYPGYLLTRESPLVTLRQVQRENPDYFDPNIGWSPMSSYASLREQQVKRGIHRPTSSSYNNLLHLQHLAAQKPIVLLVNEGTASSAEVFASALHDNGRLVAIVGTTTFGKSLVQHTFPLPDGGGLRLTVAEYLTPALRHVTRVGGAQFETDGAWRGSGIRPDIMCDGIPNSRVGADLCVGVALDALDEAESAYRESGQLLVKRVGGVDDGSSVRRAVTVGIVKDDF